MPARIAKRPKPGPQWPGFFVCALALSTAVSSNVLAQVQVTGDYVARMDADHDGRVALIEYQDWMSYAFDGMDADGDGVLSAPELPGGKGGPISRGEHRARLAARFNKQDANRDGFLDAKELAAPPR